MKRIALLMLATTIIIDTIFAQQNTTSYATDSATLIELQQKIQTELVRQMSEAMMRVQKPRPERTREFHERPQTTIHTLSDCTCGSWNVTPVTTKLDSAIELAEIQVQPDTSQQIKKIDTTASTMIARVDTIAPINISDTSKNDFVQKMKEFVKGLQYNNDSNISWNLVILERDKWSDTVLIDRDKFNSFLLNDTVAVDIQVTLPTGEIELYKDLSQKNLLKRKNGKFPYKSKMQWKLKKENSSEFAGVIVAKESKEHQNDILEKKQHINF